MTLVAVDLGRSGARVAVGDRRFPTTSGAGLGDHGGSSAVATVLRSAVGPRKKNPVETSWVLASEIGWGTSITRQASPS